MASFISFLDKLIAFQDLATAKVVADHEITQLDDLQSYLNSKLQHSVERVASDRTLTNPKKLARFDGLCDVSKQAVLGYFALRRCLEHHQSVAHEDIHVSVWGHRLFLDDTEVKELPIHCPEGQTVAYRISGVERFFPKGSRVSLDFKDVYSIVVALRGSIAPEIFNLHAGRFQP